LWHSRRERDIGVIDMAGFMARMAWSDAAKGEARGRRGAPSVTNCRWQCVRKASRNVAEWYY